MAQKCLYINTAEIWFQPQPGDELPVESWAPLVNFIFSLQQDRHAYSGHPVVITVVKNQNLMCKLLSVEVTKIL